MLNRTKYPVNFNHTITQLKNNKTATIDLRREKEYAYFHKKFLSLSQRKLTPTHWFNIVAALIDEMFTQNLLPTALIFGEIINELAGFGFFIYLEKVLEAATTRNIAPAYLYNTSLIALAQNKLPPIPLALKIFNKAIASMEANSSTYKAIIDVIAMSVSPNSQLAMQLLRQAKVAGMANTSVYLSAIDAIAKSPTPDTDLALQLMEEANFVFFPSMRMRTTTIDLFNLSFGLAYFYLKIKFTELLLNNQNQITIDYSTGRNSRTEVNFSEAATHKIIREIQSYGLPIRVVENNPGELSITLGTPLPNHSPRLFQPLNSQSNSAVSNDTQQQPSYANVLRTTP